MNWKQLGNEYDRLGMNLCAKKHFYLYGMGNGACELLQIFNVRVDDMKCEIHYVDRDV